MYLMAINLFGCKTRCSLFGVDCCLWRLFVARGTLIITGTVESIGAGNVISILQGCHRTLVVCRGYSLDNELSDSPAILTNRLIERRHAREVIKTE